MDLLPAEGTMIYIRFNMFQHCQVSQNLRLNNYDEHMLTMDMTTTPFLKKTLYTVQKAQHAI